MSSETKQVILVRRDLRMKRASIAALVAKASTKFLLENDESDAEDSLHIKLSPLEVEWLQTGCTRIVLGVATEGILSQLAFKAEVEGIPVYSVTGKTPDLYERGGDDETLCVALGPEESSKIDEITGNLKLL